MNFTFLTDFLVTLSQCLYLQTYWACSQLNCSDYDVNIITLFSEIHFQHHQSFTYINFMQKFCTNFCWFIYIQKLCVTWLKQNMLL